MLEQPPAEKRDCPKRFRKFTTETVVGVELLRAKPKIDKGRHLGF